MLVQVPTKVIPSQQNGPYAFKTVLGWCVVGSLQTKSLTEIHCNRIILQHNTGFDNAKHCFVNSSKVKDVGIPETLQLMYNRDLSEPSLEHQTSPVAAIQDEFSINDRKFLKMMDLEAVTTNYLYR